MYLRISVSSKAAAHSWVSSALLSVRTVKRAKISTSVSVASAWCRAKNVSPLEVIGDRSFSPAQARERASARRGPLRARPVQGAWQHLVG